MFKKSLTIIVYIVLTCSVFSQTNNYSKSPVVDYSDPKEYIVQDVKIVGVQFLDTKVLVSMSGLVVGRKVTVPGDDITKIVEKFWSQGLFSDVKLVASKIEGDKIWLEIYLKERPRLTKLAIKGISKSDADDIIEKLKIKPGHQVTDNVINNIVSIIKRHYKEKGFLNTKVDIVQKEDTLHRNQVYLIADVHKNGKVKISTITFIGNEKYSNKRLRRVFKKTKQKDYNLFTPNKFIESKYKEDKKKLQDFYAKNGFRDFKLLSDSIKTLPDNKIALFVKINEGNQYHFRKITWIGNTKYPSELLDRVLKLKKGDVYDQLTLEKRLETDEDAVHSLYLDYGYLFSNITPIESRIENDSIDLDLIIQEGRQATINKIIISGNTKTNEHVVRRELFTRPGDLFSKSDIVKSVRFLAQLGHFDPEKMEPVPIPNQSDGTVDIEYKLTEKANDQLELSGGWGYKSLIGTVGLKFSNFSARHIFEPKAWRPVPSGDGQNLTLRVQSNGSWMRTVSMSFTEPWFGGKKPNSFSFSIYHQIYDLAKQQNLLYGTFGGNSSAGALKMTGVSVGLGRRLKWPDDYFGLSNELGYQHYYLNSYNYGSFPFSDGNSNTITFKTTLTRSSIDQQIYPRRGSMFSLGLQLTPPFSAFKKSDFWVLSSAERASVPANDATTQAANIYKEETARKYRFIEYHKWSYKGMWVNSLVGNLVLSLNTQFGYMGYYSKNLGYSPFEGYLLGGDGMTWNSMMGTEIIGLRGYTNSSVTPYTTKKTYGTNTKTTQIANIYDKVTAELRYPLTLQPSATIYGLVFAEGGNSWYDAKDFNPFSMKRSAGVGVRAFLPMFGMLGIDWGYGFDAIPGQPSANKSQFHFTMGQQF
jgi:outer membrane protein insertion porin family